MAIFLKTPYIDSVMRTKLSKINGQRDKFKATVKRFGTRIGYKGYPIKTILLINIIDMTGKEVSDHLWFDVGKTFEKVKLEEGDRIQFHARVKPYWKGYRGNGEMPDLDYKLSYPSQIVKISNK